MPRRRSRSRSKRRGSRRSRRHSRRRTKSRRKRSKSRRKRSKSRRKSAIVGATVPLAALLVGSLGSNLYQYSKSKRDRLVSEIAQERNVGFEHDKEQAEKEALHARARVEKLIKENEDLEKKLKSKLSDDELNRIENRNVELIKEVELLRERLESQRNMPPIAPPRVNQQGVPVGPPPVVLAMNQPPPPPPAMMAPPVLVRASSAPMPRVSGKKRSRASRPKSSMTLMEQLQQKRRLKSATARELPPLRGPAGNPMAELKKRLQQRREYVAPVAVDDDDDDWDD